MEAREDERKLFLTSPCIFAYTRASWTKSFLLILSDIIGDEARRRESDRRARCDFLVHTARDRLINRNVETRYLTWGLAALEGFEGPTSPNQVLLSEET